MTTLSTWKLRDDYYYNKTWTGLSFAMNKYSIEMHRHRIREKYMERT